jgi:hypothetical protein
MFPILMDEPDAMTVAPRAWQLLQDAWRGTPAPPRKTTGTHRVPLTPAPTAQASPALGAAPVDARRHH